MPRTEITPRRRRILTLRHRDTVWQDALDFLFDKDGKPLTYSVLLARDGYGTREGVFRWFESRCLAELALMVEARPVEGAAVSTRWTAWFREWKQGCKL